MNRTSTPPRPEPAIARSQRIDGIDMRWIERGRGRPIVFVHGIPTSPTLWRHVLPRISGHHLLAWEMVGYGESIPEGRDRDISVGAQAGYLRAWMRALDIESAVLVGHDLGGGVVQIAAVRDPSICAGLVLTNAIGYDSWPIPEVKIMRKAGFVVRHLPDKAVSTALSMLFHRGHDDRRMAKDSRKLHFAPYADHGAGKALVRQLDSLDTDDTLAVQDRLPELRGRPARIVWGADDPFQKLEYGERFATDLACELIHIPGAKHFVPEDHPDVLAHAIEAVAREAWPAHHDGADREPGHATRYA